jgi:hypothetical protein
LKEAYQSCTTGRGREFWRKVLAIAGKDVLAELRSREIITRCWSLPFGAGHLQFRLHRRP